MSKEVYMAKYRDARKEYIKEHNREYRQKNMRSIYVRYIGVCTCSKCGEKGYKYYHRNINIKTNCKHSIYAVVVHKHVEKYKEIFEKCCYIGIVKE